MTKNAHTSRLRRALLAWPGLLALPALRGQAATPIRTLGVFSLLGDELLIVQPADPTDTRIQRQSREALSQRDIGFDQAALRGVREVLSARAPQARLQMFRANAPISFAEQRSVADGAVKAELPAWIVGAIGQAKLSHLLIVTRTRGDAAFPTNTGDKIGRGTVDGIGFYIDKTTELKNLDTGGGALGFLGAFVMLRIQLMDASSGDIIGSQDVRVGQMFAGRRDAEAENVWNALDPAEKVEVLRKMIEENVARVMPAVLDGRK
jgi:hypothetical protein